MIRVYEPYITNKSRIYVNETISSGWISWHGTYSEKVAESLSNLVGTDYCLLVSSGTTGMHIASCVLKKFYPKVKRLVFPSAAYIAAYSPFMFDGDEFDIILEDLSMDTWNPSYDIEAGEDTAFVITHNVGNTVNVLDLKKRYPDSIFIEDNCEGFMGEYDNSPTGSAADISVCSFFANKTITCGEGGAVFLKDKDQYEYAMKIRGQGQSEKRFIHDEMGYNYRLTNVQAALLYGQLEELKIIKENKRRIFNRYRKNLDGVFKIPTGDPNTKSSEWMFGVESKRTFDEVSHQLSKSEIECRPMFYPYSYHGWLPKPISGCENNAKYLSERCVILPSSPNLDDFQVDYICENLIKGEPNE